MKNYLETRMNERENLKKSLFKKIEKAVQMQDIDEIQNISILLKANEERIRELEAIYRDNFLKLE